MRTTRDTYHHGSLREAAVGVALSEITSVGAERISLRKIAQQLGVSHPALYRHFRNKDALLSDVAKGGFVALHQGLEEATRGFDDPFEALRVGAVFYSEFAADNGALYDLMFGARVAGVVDDDALARERERCFAVVAALVQNAARCTPRQALDHTVRIWTMLHGYCALRGVQRLPTSGGSRAEAIRLLIEPLVVSWALPHA